jgi:hypothetical protein
MGFERAYSCILFFNWYIAILASFVNFLLPDRGFGEGWGGVKNYSNPRIICEFLTPERAGSGRVGVG